jgi:hypothetical protein
VIAVLGIEVTAVRASILAKGGTVKKHRYAMHPEWLISRDFHPDVSRVRQVDRNANADRHSLGAPRQPGVPWCPKTFTHATRSSYWR